MAEHDCWPTPAQQDLLLAALAEPERAAQAWARYRNRPQAHIEIGEARLLPLVDANLRAAAARNHASDPAREPALDPSRDPSLAAARAQRRKAAAGNELLFRAVAPVIAALADSGIEVILLKGAALTLRHYEAPGLRPMGDVDVLVKQSQARDAVDVLTRCGLRAKTQLSPRRMQLVHGEDFSDERGRHLDLHWRLLPQRWSEDTGLWERSERVDFAGVPARVLSAADELLHVIVHGLHWSPEATLRWASDAAAIIASRRASVDWDVLVAESARLRLTAPVREGLRYLTDELGIAVPAQVHARLAAVPVSRAQELEYRLGCRRSTYTVLGGLPVFAYQYANDARAHGRRPQPIGFLSYLAEYWAYDSVGDVLRRMIERGALRLWSRATGRALPPPKDLSARR